MSLLSKVSYGGYYSILRSTDVLVGPARPRLIGGFLRRCYWEAFLSTDNSQHLLKKSTVCCRDPCGVSWLFCAVGGYLAVQKKRRGLLPVLYC